MGTYYSLGTGEEHLAENESEEERAKKLLPTLKKREAAYQKTLAEEKLRHAARVDSLRDLKEKTALIRLSGTTWQEELTQMLEQLSGENVHENEAGIKPLRDAILAQVHYLKEKYGNSYSYINAGEAGSHAMEFLRDHHALTNMGELLKFCMKVPSLFAGCEKELHDALSYVDYIGAVNPGFSQVQGMPSFAMSTYMRNQMLTVTCTNYTGLISFSQPDGILLGLESEQAVRTDIRWDAQAAG